MKGPPRSCRGSIERRVEVSETLQFAEYFIVHLFREKNAVCLVNYKVIVIPGGRAKVGDISSTLIRDELKDDETRVNCCTTGPFFITGKIIFALGQQAYVIGIGCPGSPSRMSSFLLNIGYISYKMICRVDAGSGSRLDFLDLLVSNLTHLP
jgi:hypothetical protein